MKALCWEGKKDVQVKDVPQPKILNPRDAIIRVTSTAICGSDLHLYGGFIPTMKAGDILGHEFMGVVEETGPGVRNLKVGDRVIVPFTIACGGCFFCLRGMTAACDNSNPNAAMAEKVMTFSGSALFGYGHMNGGYAGGQAEYVRVPFADVGPFKIPSDVEDDRALFLTDIFPTGYMAAENCNIQNGDTVAVFGCGPVGQFAIRSAFILGAARVIAIDMVKERLDLARSAGAEVLDENEGDVIQRLAEITGGMGPDSCIDAVGLEAHGHGLTELYDQVKQAVYLETDRPIVLRTALMACRKGGTVSVPGVYAGIIDKVPMGVAFAKGLTLKMGQTHVHRYLPHLLSLIQSGRIDPSFVITHRKPLTDAAELYATFLEKKDKCIKVVLKP